LGDEKRKRRGKGNGSSRRKKEYLVWNNQLILRFSYHGGSGTGLRRRSERSVVWGERDIYIYKTAKDKTCTVHRLSVSDQCHKRLLSRSLILSRVAIHMWTSVLDYVLSFFSLPFLLVFTRDI